MTLAGRTIVFVNIAHALDHFVLLVYPTAVLVIAVERGTDYAALIGLSTGAFVAFGLFSLPVGWLTARVGERPMMAAFFFGCGGALLGLATATRPTTLAAWLLLLGIFAAIYHPVGSTLLVSHTQRLGRALGWNGVWGNLGAASASGITALIAAVFGWRAAFALPGILCFGVGIAFLVMVPDTSPASASAPSQHSIIPVRRPIVLLGLFIIAIIASGITYNVTTVALPKMLDEGLEATLPLLEVGTIATGVLLVGAAMQLLMGRLVDRFSLPSIFVCLALLQPLGLFLAAMNTGMAMLLGLILATMAIYGQVVVNDAMVARYIPCSFRTQAFSIRYFLGFTAAGFAVPAIALFHERGGFPFVLAAAGCFGAAIFTAALLFMLLAQRRVAAPAVLEPRLREAAAPRAP